MRPAGRIVALGAVALTGILASMTLFGAPWPNTWLRGGTNHAEPTQPTESTQPTQPTQTPTPTRTTPADIPLGVFRQTDSAAVQDFQTWLGAPVSDVVDFSARNTWTAIAEPDYLLQEWQDTGYRLVYAVPMLPTDQRATMRAGADGAYDHYFSTLAAGLVKYGHQDAVLRIGWEFNLQSWPWSTPDQARFIAYFRHIATAMKSVPGQHFVIDWNVNNATNAYDATSYYPGDDVVDYVGVDAYDVAGDVYPYPKNCDSRCRTARQQTAWTTRIYGGKRGLKFWAGFAAAHGKPLSLPEWGLWGGGEGFGGGDDPVFVAQMHDFITDPANHVAYQAYFEFDGENGRHSLQSSFPVAGAEFRRLFGGVG